MHVKESPWFKTEGNAFSALSTLSMIYRMWNKYLDSIRLWPRRPTVFWAALKEEWPAGRGRWLYTSTQRLAPYRLLWPLFLWVKWIIAGLLSSFLTDLRYLVDFCSYLEHLSDSKLCDLHLGVLKFFFPMVRSLGADHRTLGSSWWRDKLGTGMAVLLGERFLL